jgi:pimeloyl-ACP methyl ester carboxylesterase
MDGETQQLKAGSLTLECLTGEHGDSVLVLHDIEYLNTWQPFEANLAAKSYRVVVPSHPGFGASERPDWLDSVDDLAYVYLDLLRELGPSHVVGLGFGGWIAAEMAVRSEEDVRSLVLVDSVGIKVGDHLSRDIDDTFVMKPREFLAATWHDPEAGAAAMKLPGVTELTDAEVLTVMRNRESAALYAWNPFMHNPKLAGRLQRIRVPSLVLWGESDRVVTPDYGRALAQRIPGAAFETIVAAGHYPYLEQPDAFAGALASFLQQQPKE